MPSAHDSCSELYEPDLTRLLGMHPEASVLCVTDCPQPNHLCMHVQNRLQRCTVRCQDQIQARSRDLQCLTKIAGCCSLLNVASVDSVRSVIQEKLPQNPSQGQIEQAQVLACLITKEHHSVLLHISHAAFLLVSWLLLVCVM